MCGGILRCGTAVSDQYSACTSCTCMYKRAQSQMYFLNDNQFIVPVLMIVSQHICRTAKRNSIFNVVQCRKEDLETVFREMDLLEIFKTFVKSH